MLYSRQKPIQVAFSQHPVANLRNLFVHLFCSLADEELALQSPVSERVIAWRRFKVKWNKVCQSRHPPQVHIRGPNTSFDQIGTRNRLWSYYCFWQLCCMLKERVWAAREAAAGSVLHAKIWDWTAKHSGPATSINPSKSSCKKYLTWYTKSCCFRHKRTWHNVFSCC